jgi:hypothetical protein
MRDPDAKQVMTRLALTYDRLATLAALREASEQNTPSKIKVEPTGARTAPGCRVGCGAPFQK